jgi:uncharacterized protein YcbX
MAETVGTVKTLSRFPVKSMQGEKLASAEVTSNGLVGDRAYALVETETGKVLSGKTPRLGPQLLSCRAEFVEAPESVAEPPPVRITVPDGTAVTSDTRNANATISAFLGREVTLQRAAPENFTIDQYHPDIEGADPPGLRDTTTESKLGSAFFAQVGMPSPVPVGSFFDLFPASVLTTSTLARLQSLRPESRFDERRFRMNFVLDTPEEGFVENAWIGHSLQIGDSVRLAVLLADPRCVMTTLAQDELPKDNEVLKTLVRNNKIDVAGALYPCAGVYAVVEAAGTARASDSVLLT